MTGDDLWRNSADSYPHRAHKSQPSASSHMRCDESAGTVGAARPSSRRALSVRIWWTRFTFPGESRRILDNKKGAQGAARLMGHTLPEQTLRAAPRRGGVGWHQARGMTSEWRSCVVLEMNEGWEKHSRRGQGREKVDRDLPIARFKRPIFHSFPFGFISIAIPLASLLHLHYKYGLRAAHNLIPPMSSYASRSQSPPPRMPSPQLLPTPLPSPRPLPRKQSRQRLQLPLTAPDSPPIPPTLIGSPLLKKGIFAPRPKPQPPLNVDLWADGDDFGARKEKSHSLPPSLRERGGRFRHRRSASISVSPHMRPRSPPPSPCRPTPPPPVPPIPAFLLASSPKKPILQPRSTNQPELAQIPELSHTRTKPTPSLRPAKSVEAMTCMRFFALHNPRSVAVDQH